MANILCSAIVDKVELQLRDEGNDRWDADDLFGWLKSGQRQIAIFKPDASVTNGASGALAAGVKQTIPTGGIQLINITHNLGTDGTTPGAAITCVTLKTMAAVNPDWLTDTADDVVENYMLDERDPKNYYVYPPQPSSGQGQVNIVHAVTPADPASISASITLDDIYETVLIDYILYRAYGEDAAQSPYAKARSTEHWNMFVESLGRKDLKEQQDSPKP